MGGQHENEQSRQTIESQSAPARPRESGSIPQASIVDRRFVLDDQLGEGGMGRVFRASDRLLRRSVALKLLRETTAEAATLSSDNELLAMAREFQTLSSLHHPNVIRVLDYGFDLFAGPYFTMMLVDAPQTITECAAGLHSYEDKLLLLAQLLRALSYVHRRGIIHRDLKPSNVLCVAQHVYLADFGLATKAGDPTDFSGTPLYMAPELWQGAAPSVESDLFAFGMIAREVLLGDPASAAEGGQAPPASPPPPLAVQAVIGKLLSSEASARYHTARQVLEEFGASTGANLDFETIDVRESYLQASAFIGRAEPLEQLLKALEAARAGRGSTFLLGGESGIGKSRLIAELRTRALVGNAIVATGQAVVEGGAPYDLWIPVLRALCLRADVPDTDAAVLADIVPELSELLGFEFQPAARVHPAAMRSRLHGAVENLLRRQRHVTLILLEDLQWSSADGLELLAQVSGLADALPVLIVGSYRDDEAPELPHKLPGAATLTLSRLDQREIAQLAVSMLGSRGGQSDIVDYLSVETEGNVFFAVEIVRALAEQAGRLDRISQLHLQPGMLTGGIAQIIRQRVDRVPAQHRDALESAAVLGRELDLAVLQRVEPSLEIEAWLASCANAAVLESREEGWRFAHDKLREALLADMNDEARRVRHRRAASALEEAYPEARFGAKSARLAYHFVEAGQHDRAAVYSSRAGDHATRLCAYEEARAHYAAATRALEQLAPSTEWRRQKIDVLLQQVYITLVAASAEQNFKRVEEARLLFREVERAGPLQDEDRMRLARLDYVHGRIHFYRGETREALTYYRRVLPVGLATGDEELLALPGCLIGSAVLIQGDALQAEPLLAQAIEPLERLGEPFEWFRAVGYHGLSLVAQGHYEAGLAELARVRARAAEIDQPSLLSAAYLMSGSTCLFSGDWPLVIAYLTRTLEFATQTGDKLHSSLALSGISWAHAHLNEHADAESCRTRALQIAAELGGQLMLNDWYRAADAEIALLAGDVELALERAKAVLAAAGSDNQLFSSGIAERVWGESLALRGAHLEADRHLQQSVALHARGGIHVQVARTEFRWALQLRRRGETDRADALSTRAFEQFAKFRCSYALAESERAWRAEGLLLGSRELGDRNTRS